MEMSFAPCLWYWQAYLEELHAWDNYACDIEGDLQTWSDKRPFLAFFTLWLTLIQVFAW